MGKNSIIRMYQNARFLEWIGSFKEAEIIYSEIEKSNEALSTIMLPTVISQKKKLDVRKKENQLLDENRVPEILEDEPKLFKMENLKPKKMNLLTVSGNTTVQWNYSVSVVSKAGTDLRLEIKGFHSTEMKPNLKFTYHNFLSGWDIGKLKCEPNDEKIDLIWFIASYSDNTRLYLSIDRWGLLNGTVVTSEDELGNTLSALHLLFVDLGKRIWVNG